MSLVNVYLNFDGDCEQAFNFYKSVFGGEFAYFGRFKDNPPMPGHEMPASEAERIMHVALPISKETVLMASDTSALGPPFQRGNNFSISYSADNKDDADRIHSQLSAGGTVTMPMDTMFWGAYFGMLTDKFGINWMVSYDQNNQQ